MRFLKRQNTNSAALNGRGIRYEANEISEINSNNALIVPKGSNAQRPGTSSISPVTGMIRYNTDEEYFEVYALDNTYFTPGWQRFRTETPKLIKHQNLGVGDDVEILFGPLDSGDPQVKEPYAARPEQILVYLEGYYQRPLSNTQSPSPDANYNLVQNPCRVSSNRVGFYADGVAFEPQASGFATIRSWDLAYVNFFNLGFYADQTIVISGSASNNGTYLILAVDTNGEYMTLQTALANEINSGFATVMTVDGFKNSTVSSGTVNATSSSGNQVYMNSITGAPDVGQEIIFDGAMGNLVADKRYIIDSNTSPNITVRSLEKGIATATFPAVSVATVSVVVALGVAQFVIPTQTFAPFYVGQTITVSGVTPAGFNGTHTVTACTASSVSYATASVGPLTVAGTIASVNNEIIVNSSSTLTAGMEIVFAGAYAYQVGQVSATNSTGNLITVDSTTGLIVGMQIVFNGNQVGNLVPETEYYILTIPGGTTITISATLGGAAFNPGTASGSMYFTASGATMGNIAVDTIYYVLSTPTATSVVISATSGGAQFAITRDTGYVVWESTQVSAITMTNAAGLINWVSGSMYSNTTTNNTYLRFFYTSGLGGDVVGSGIPVTAIHNFDK